MVIAKIPDHEYKERIKKAAKLIGTKKRQGDWRRK